MTIKIVLEVIDISISYIKVIISWMQNKLQNKTIVYIECGEITVVIDANIYECICIHVCDYLSIGIRIL